MRKRLEEEEGVRRRREWGRGLRREKGGVNEEEA